MNLDHSAFLKLKQDVFHLNQMDIQHTLLREALIILNKLGLLYSDQQAISKIEYQEIFNLVKEIIKNKLLELNPTLNDRVLHKIFSSVHRGLICVLEDFQVIDHNFVFVKEGQLDDFGNLYRECIFYISDHHIDNLKEVNDENLEFSQNQWDKDYLFNQMFHPPDYTKVFDSKATEKLVTTLSQYINSILFEHFHQAIVYPISELNKNGTYHGVDNLCYCSSVRVFLSYNLNQIKEAIFNHENVQFCLVALNGFDNIYQYDISQSIDNNEQLIWTWKSKTPEIWNFNNAVLEYSKKNGPLKNLSKQKNNK